MVVVHDTGAFELSDIETEYYIFLWILDMIHDKLVPSTNSDDVYFLVDVVLYAIAYNNPDLDLHVYRDLLWRIVCHYFKQPKQIKLIASTKRTEACSMNPALGTFPMSPVDTVINAVSQGLKKRKVNWTIRYFAEDICPVCTDIQGVRIVGIPELWDRSSTVSDSFGRMAYRFKKQEVQVDMLPADYVVSGTLGGRKLVLHRIKYRFNYETQKTEMTLNDRVFTATVNPVEIRQLYATHAPSEFEDLALMMIGKHIKDLGQILYVARSDAVGEPIFLFSVDRMFVNIACFIFDTPMYMFGKNKQLMEMTALI